MRKRTGIQPKRKKANDRNREQGTKSEREMARLVDMEVQPGSGSGPRKTQDLVDESHLGQVKSTRARSIAVTATALEKLEKDARRREKKPVMFLDFRTEGPVLARRKWALIPVEEWLKARE